jgi:predicted RNase H-like HicB family nuclease
MEFHATVHEEDGSYWAEVEELPGCFASGKDLNELQEALIEAINMCLTQKEHEQIRAELESEAKRQMRVGGITVATGPLVPA